MNKTRAELFDAMQNLYGEVDALYSRVENAIEDVSKYATRVSNNPYRANFKDYMRSLDEISNALTKLSADIGSDIEEISTGSDPDFLDDTEAEAWNNHNIQTLERARRILLNNFDGNCAFSSALNERVREICEGLDAVIISGVDELARESR